MILTKLLTTYIQKSSFDVTVLRLTLRLCLDSVRLLA